MLPIVLNRMNNRSLLNDYFNSNFYENQICKESSAFLPSVNIHENEKLYVIEVAAPGLAKEDFKIKLDGNLITIFADKEEKDNKTVIRKEFAYNSFERSFKFSNKVDVEQISAGYNNGVLSVELPLKKQEIPQKKEIAIK